MTRIVTTHRCKRPPPKRKAVALEVPAIVAIPAKKRRRVSLRKDAPAEAAAAAVRASKRDEVLRGINTSAEARAAHPANDDRKSAIATSISHKRARFLAQPAAGDDTDEAVTARYRAAIACKLHK